MQAAAPKLWTWPRRRTDAPALRTRRPATSRFGANCLLARRLVERGVRFIELYCGSGSGWDAHATWKRITRRCAGFDQPIAGLLTDLKARGLLDTTLVVWGGEFGRTPLQREGRGAGSRSWGFTIWMAGGGVKGGQTIGAHRRNWSFVP